jgi:hypothetical protein
VSKPPLRPERERYAEAVRQLPLAITWPGEQVAVTVLSVDPVSISDPEKYAEVKDEPIPTTRYIFKKVDTIQGWEHLQTEEYPGDTGY